MFRPYVFFRINLSNSAFRKSEKLRFPPPVFSAQHKKTCPPHFSLFLSCCPIFSVCAPHTVMEITFFVWSVSAFESADIWINLGWGWNSNRKYCRISEEHLSVPLIKYEWMFLILWSIITDTHWCLWTWLYQINSRPEKLDFVKVCVC